MPNPEWDDRRERQREVFAWAVGTFGSIAADRRERAIRLLEEAIEVAQAEGVPLKSIWRLADHVYAKPVGEPAKEAGAVSVCLLLYCEAIGVSADEVERKEVERIFGLSPVLFRARQNAKADIGVGLRTNGGDLTPTTDPA